MSKHRKKTAAETIFTDSGFYAILAASIIMICIAAYLAFGIAEEQNGADTDFAETPQSTLSAEETLEDGYVPDWPEENEYAEVNKPESHVKDDRSEIKADTNEDKTQEETTVKEVELTQPIEEAFIIETRSFSGSTPVFSESMGDWRLHHGVDYITETAVEVKAAADGIVEDVYDDGLMGISVLLLHEDGTRTLYQSLDINPEVVKGMAVSKGHVIGKTGNTADAEALLGYHLHYAVIKDGAYVEP